MDKKSFGKPKPQISDKRFLAPDANKLRLNKYHQSQAKKKSLSSKVHDLKKQIQFAERHKETTDSNKFEAMQGKLKDLNRQKRDKRKTQFIDQQYKNVKFYGSFGLREMKRVRKQLKKVEAEPDSEEKEKQLEEIREKIVYIKVAPFN